MPLLNIVSLKLNLLLRSYKRTYVARLKVPKCEIFDPFFFYTNKSYMGRWLEDWRKKKNSKTTADIRHFVFFTQAEPALKICLRRLSLR